MPLTSLLFVSILGSAAASPVVNNFVLQGSRTSAPQGFANLGPADDSSLLNLRIALQSSNITGLEKALLDVSNPSSSNYGKHLSRAQVNAFVTPTDEATAVVKTWLASHGLVAKTVSSAGDWLSVSLNTSQANDMMAAKYENFQHIGSRTLSFSLPAEVANFVAHIHPTITFKNPVGPVLSTPKPVSADDLPTPCGFGARYLGTIWERRLRYRRRRGVYLHYIPDHRAFRLPVRYLGGLHRRHIPRDCFLLLRWGFSNLWSTPDDQADAVAAYLTLQGPTNAGLFNISGRGYPDISAQGNDVPIIVDGQLAFTGGTSASTPTFASVIALLNDQLIAAGKSPLGLLNPWLYANPGSTPIPRCSTT
ncbi:Pro-kumamolisin, activation domain-containing protein [Mycena metata]|uniref:Pro-kumamolisin, activation domain-containing protein n=1 Tax=Mycena metata TaxID=1033252 RepID=A0AAD7I9Z3_9AGAR|nr:Pro-kumamolisin, activation domain-containing protein [Mycena metata]